MIEAVGWAAYTSGLAAKEQQDCLPDYAIRPHNLLTEQQRLQHRGLLLRTQTQSNSTVQSDCWSDLMTWSLGTGPAWFLTSIVATRRVTGCPSLVLASRWYDYVAYCAAF